MSFDPRRAETLRSVYEEALRTARNLASSVRRLSGTLLPIEPERMQALTEDEKDRLDAFRVRFIELQDLIGAKVFRALLALEEERSGSMLDVLHAMEKRGIIGATGAWVELRRLRNALSHDYPATVPERASAINEAARRAGDLLSILHTVQQYCRRLPLQLPPPPGAGSQ